MLKRSTQLYMRYSKQREFKGDMIMTTQGYMVYRILLQSDNSKNFMPDFRHSVVFKDKLKAENYKHAKTKQADNSTEIWLSSEIKLDLESDDAKYGL